MRCDEENKKREMVIKDKVSIQHVLTFRVLFKCALVQLQQCYATLHHTLHLPSETLDPLDISNGSSSAESCSIHSARKAVHHTAQIFISVHMRSVKNKINILKKCAKEKEMNRREKNVYGNQIKSNADIQMRVKSVFMIHNSTSTVVGINRSHTIIIFSHRSDKRV